MVFLIQSNQTKFMQKSNLKNQVFLAIFYWSIHKRIFNQFLEPLVSKLIVFLLATVISQSIFKDSEN